MSEFKPGINQSSSNLTSKLKSQFKDGLLSTLPSAQFISGGRVDIKINGQLTTNKVSINWTITTEQVEIRSIDSQTPVELAPGKISVVGTIVELRKPNESPTKMNYQGTILSNYFHPYIKIEVRDKTTDALLFYAGKAAVTSRQETVTPEDLMQTTLTFSAIGWQDETKPEIPYSNKPVPPAEIAPASPNGGSYVEVNPNKTIQAGTGRLVNLKKSFF